MGKERLSRLLGWLDDHVIWPVERVVCGVKYWIAYRTYDKYHVVVTDLKPDYYDKDTILLHACFSILVDYVEFELAWMETIMGCDDRFGKWFRRLPRFVFRRLAHLHVKKYGRELGLRSLDWKINYSDSNVGEEWNSYHQGVARDTKTLYIWWKDIRPTRKEPSEAVGLDAFYENMRAKYGEIFRFEPVSEGFSRMVHPWSEEEDAEANRLMKESWELEEKYHTEDEECLIKLMKIRRTLWT